MNVEGLKNDSKATPLNTLPPPVMTSNADGPKLDGSTDVLNYDDILRSMDNKPAQQQQGIEQERPLQEYYEDEDDDGIMTPEEMPMMTAPRYRRRRRPSPKNVARRRRPAGDEKSVVQKYKHLVLVLILVGLVLYFGLPKLHEFVPSTFVSTATLSPVGVAIATAVVGAGYYVGDTYVLSKI